MPITLLAIEAKTMKTHNSIGNYILLVAGVLLMTWFGSKIGASIAPSKSGAGYLLLPGYSVGLIMISGAMFVRLRAEVRDLQSRIEKLGNAKG